MVWVSAAAARLLRLGGNTPERLSGGGTQMTELESLTSRLQKVERDNRRMKLAGCLTGLIAAALLLMGQARPGHKQLEAQELVLRDSSGRIRALLTASPEPHLTLFDAKEEMRADMSAGAEGGFLALLEAT